MQYRLSHYLTSLYFTILYYLSSIHTAPHHITYNLPTPNYITLLLLLSIPLSHHIISPSSHYLTLITSPHPHHITSLYFTPPLSTSHHLTPNIKSPHHMPSHITSHHLSPSHALYISLPLLISHHTISNQITTLGHAIRCSLSRCYFDNSF